MIDKQSYEQGFNKGYIYGIEAENQNFIRNLEEYLYRLEKRREKGDIVIGYWQVKKMIEEIIEQCKLDKGDKQWQKNKKQ